MCQSTAVKTTTLAIWKREVSGLVIEAMVTIYSVWEDSHLLLFVRLVSQTDIVLFDWDSGGFCCTPLNFKIVQKGESPLGRSLSVVKI